MSPAADALDILTDHAEIQANMFRGAIAEKEGAQRYRIFLPCPRRHPGPWAQGPGLRARARGCPGCGGEDGGARPPDEDSEDGEDEAPGRARSPAYDLFAAGGRS